MAIDRNSFVWPSAGIEPSNEEDALYRAGDQPIAGYDNFIMWAVTEDIRLLDQELGNHVSAHQYGGTQELDLNNLSVNDAAMLNGDAGRGEFRLLQMDGTSRVRLDMDDDRVRQWPAYAVPTRHWEGIEIGNDLERRDGEVIYDYSANKFHHATEADWADNAGHADTADALSGNAAGDFLQPGDDAVITGDWSFDLTVDADISGHASTASSASTADSATTAGYADDAGLLDGTDPGEFPQRNKNEDIYGDWHFHGNINADISGSVDHADTADWADNAGHADTAGDADTLDGLDQTAFGRLAQNETVTGTWTFNNTITADISGDADHALTADYATDAGSATSADSASEADWAQTAEYANNADKLDGYHADEIIDQSGGGGSGRWSFIDAWDVSTGNSWSWDLDLTTWLDSQYDQYKLAVVCDTNVSNDNRLFVQLNQDKRDRYYYLKLNRSSTGFDHEIVTANAWPIAHTRSGYTGYSEYIISKPPGTSANNATNYPSIARDNHTGHPAASGGTLYHGRLTTNYSSIDHIHINPHREAAAYIALYGNNHHNTTQTL